MTYNNERQLEESWKNFDAADARWVVVDNASTDRSVAIARDLGATVVERDANYGFSSSNNVGLASASTPYVAFVNPDVTVAPRSLDTLRRSVDLHGGFVAPQLYYGDDTPQPNARGLPTVAQKFANRGARLPWVDPSAYARVDLPHPTYVAWAIGAAIAGRRDSFDLINGWDDKYFIYYEDHDLGLRAWLNGLTVVLDPGITWRHTWQRETTGVNLSAWRHELRSALRFYRQYPDLLTFGRVRRSKRLHRTRAHLWTPADRSSS
ncbi:glycosyltransferase family 2 protein [Aeromicrobium sp. 50.2.37]|uniref:glycosyltransferase family 2 protein n=1 Tax=Aeromicrobium sp. 50.2.37 TaxID=2969305 RepID=UPI00215065EB|nr:glycosyltransferase [Aeromicrobium sp. 50.2.37]MCR4513040.1 glycosyltransferase [Aeromicrobium sp. 50.2.37]